MKLFALRTKTRALVKDDNKQPIYFGSKNEARQYRASITEDTNKYFITLGIDHKLYKGE